ncbi:MAG: hypothetical protein WAN36_08520, partial [Calditrichia bacterium]
SYLSNGLSADAYFKVIEPNKKFEWGFDNSRGGKTRYTATSNGSSWKEEGEYSADGKNWSKFFEMSLTKVRQTE